MTDLNRKTDLMLASAKWAFTTRRVPREAVSGLDPRVHLARPGDLVLCEVLRIGQHRNIQMAEGRPATLYTGDRVVVVLGDRYAPDQFHATATIAGEVADLVAGGGIVGQVDAAHAKMDAPTKLRPVALLTDSAGVPANVQTYALPRRAMDPRPTVLGVFGASMNSGKTTATACLAHGLMRSGLAVAAIKATGTGAFGDYHTFADAGVPALDFTDVGMATTYRMPMQRIEEGFATLVAHCANAGTEVIVCEIADGVFQQETRAILQGGAIRDRLDGILFAAPDALSALGGVMFLERLGLSPFALAGMLSLSPLATSEAEAVTGLPVLTREKLCDPGLVRDLVAPYLRRDDLGRSAA
jgi:hypothetical protein